MVMEKTVAVVENRQVAIQELETRFAMAVRQRELLEHYIKERLHPGKHFYKIERSGDETRGGQQKPSLTKEGAELICLPHSLKARYEWLSGIENPPLDDSPYQITMKCILERAGVFEGEGVGSASSMITKKDGTRVQRQRDPGLRHNATIKMACKSAYIAATLNATAASEFFTQDLEDDKSGEESQPEAKGHYCTLHKTPFFKRGRMKNYAHPIEGTDDWCNEQPAVTSESHVVEEIPPEAPLVTTEVAERETSPVAPGELEQLAGIGIDMNWVRESMKAVKWTEATIKSYLANIYKISKEGRLEDVIARLNREQKEKLTKEIQDRLEMV